MSLKGSQKSASSSRLATVDYLWRLVVSITVLALWLAFRFGGDRWWLATLLLFGPRWIFALPTVPFAALSAFGQRKLLWVVAASAFVLAFPVLGLCVPWARAFSVAGPRLRVLTYNVGIDAVPADDLAVMIRQVEPDIVAMQECTPATYAHIFSDWHVCDHGDLLIAARFPIQVRQVSSTHVPLHEWPRATMLDCVVASPDGEIVVGTLHLPSPRYGLSALVDKMTLIAPSRRGLLEAETVNRDKSVTAHLLGG